MFSIVAVSIYIPTISARDQGWEDPLDNGMAPYFCILT